MKNKKISNICGKISKIIIYFIAFIIPVFSLSRTTEGIDFHKQVILIFLVFSALFFWAVRIFTKGKLSLNFHKFNIAVFVLLLITIFSVIFSLYRYGSFWGIPLDVASSLLTLLGLVIYYFLIINLLRKKEDILWLLIVLIFSGFIVTLIGNFQVIGLWSSFNTVGSVMSLGLFAASILVLISSLIFGITYKSIKYLLFGVGLIILIFIFLVNSWIAWLVLSVGLIIILLIGTSHVEFIKNSLWLLLSVVLVAALFFGIFRVSLLKSKNVSPKTILPLKESLEVAEKSLKSYPLLGSGPGTFSYSYHKFEPEEINDTELWNVRFDSASSSFLDRIITTGILGLLSWIGLIVSFIFVAVKRFLKTPDLIKTILNLGIFSAWAVLAFGLFLYPSNLSLEFLFWIFMACFIALDKKNTKKWKFKPSLLFKVFFIFLLLLVFVIRFLFGLGQKCAAEINYSKALKAIQDNKNKVGIEYITKAVKLTDGNQDNYLRDLAQLYLVESLNELKKEEQDLDYAVQLIGRSINFAMNATEASNKNSTNWTTSGFIYKQAANLDSAAIDWAIKSYKEAIFFEPFSPFLYIELGEVYLVKANNEKQNSDNGQYETNLLESQKYFQRAIELKQDYIVAYRQLAQTFWLQGKPDKAINLLESIKENNPYDVDTIFRLGLIYYNNNQLSKSKKEFELLTSLNKNYSNAYYMLGLIYNKEGNKDKAIENFIKVARLNPDNQEIMKILENLKSGKPLLDNQETTKMSDDNIKIKLPVSE